MALEKPETWQRMMARDGARFLMLGTPNGGSWSPMQTLSGDDTFGNALAAFGSLFDNGGATQGDGRHAGLPAAAGRAARSGLAARPQRDLAEARRRRHGAPAREEPLARRGRAARDLSVERAAAERARPVGRAAAAASTRRPRRCPTRRRRSSSSAMRRSRRAASSSATAASNTPTRSAAATAACR
jgi:hypothetical protein